MRRKVFCFIALVATLAPSEVAATPIERLAIRTPRPFGYVIGDRIRHQIDLDLKAPYVLEAGSLPKAGNLDYWLELRAVEVEETQQETTRRYRIALTYQSFYGPLEVKPLTIPAFKLSITDGEEPVEVPVPAWEFTASPLRPLAVRTSEGGDYGQPDVVPPPFPTGGHWLRFGLFAAGVLVTLPCTLWLYGRWPSQWRQPFARASRDLRRLSKMPSDPDAYRQALRRVHQAFNETAGSPVFASDIAQFIARHPVFSPLRGEIERFFTHSRQLFFAPDATGDTYSLEAVERLCHACRRQERMAP